MSGRPLSILQILTHNKINAGGAVQAFLLSRELARRGHSVTMCFSEREGGGHGATRAKVEAAGCRYVGLRMRSLSSILGLRALLREEFDVVHLHRELALQRFLQAAPLSPGTGAVANVGTSKLPSAARARRLRSSRVDRIVVVAEALKRLLVRTARVDPTRIDVVYGAFDELRFEDHATPLDRQADLTIAPGAKLVGLIGNLDPKKGHRIFLRAARLVLDQRSDVYFVFAGKGPASKLHGFADAAGVPHERLRFLGFRDDVPRVLSTLDASICASTKGEGLTGSIRESMAMGIPVISTAIAGNVEIVTPGETGLLVPPKDPAALANAILATLADPAAARERARRGRAHVRSQFTSGHRAAQMERIYDEIRTYREVRRMDVRSILYPSRESSRLPVEGGPLP